MEVQVFFSFLDVCGGAGGETETERQRGGSQRALVVFMYLRTAMVILKVQESHGGHAGCQNITQLISKTIVSSVNEIAFRLLSKTSVWSS